MDRIAERANERVLSGLAHSAFKSPPSKELPDLIELFENRANSVRLSSYANCRGLSDVCNRDGIEPAGVHHAARNGVAIPVRRGFGGLMSFCSPPGRHEMSSKAHVTDGDDIRPVKCRTWAELLAACESLPGWIFRGHCSHSWQLLTTLDRSVPSGERKRFAEHNTLTEFKRAAHNYLQAHHLPANDGEWLALMQHF